MLHWTLHCVLCCVFVVRTLTDGKSILVQSLIKYECCTHKLCKMYPIPGDNFKCSLNHFWCSAIYSWLNCERIVEGCVGTNKSIRRCSNVNDVLHFTIYWNLCVRACTWFCAINVFNKRINLNWDGHVARMTTMKHFDNTKYKWFYTWFYSFMSGVVVMLRKTHKIAQKH